MIYTILVSEHERKVLQIDLSKETLQEEVRLDGNSILLYLKLI